jgi:drug/metabolite transporter (DMT)-like permease
MLTRALVAIFGRWLDLVLVGCVVLIWGLSWPVMKSSVAIIPPIWFTVLRYLIGALVLTAILTAFGRLRIPHRRDLPVVLSVGLLQMLVFTALAATALQILPTGRAVVLAYTMPLWVLLLGAQIGRRQAMAGALGLAGILALVDIGGFFKTGMATLVPCALLLTAALAWAVCMIHVHHHRWIGATLDLAPWQMALATICLVPLAFALEGAPRISWMVDTWGSLLFVGVLATAFCSWAVVDVGTRTGAGVVSIAMLGVPAVGLVASFIVGQETPTLAVVAGSAAILFSISVVASEALKT